MAVAIKVPQVGESITEGVLAQWLKKDGDSVREGEPLFELETDKATQAVPAPATGVLHINIQEGKTVAIGAEVGSIDPKATAQAPAKKDEPTAKPARNDQPREDRKPDREEKALSPAVRRLTQEEKVDVNQIEGTGRGGRVTKENVVHHLEKQKAAPQPTSKSQPTAPAPESKPPASPPWDEPAPVRTPAVEPRRGEQRQRMTPIRQRIAQRLVTSQQTTATLTTFNEADLSAVMEWRSRYKDKFKDRYEVNLGFMSFFVKAGVEALKAFPQVNGRIEGTEIIIPASYHIGVAVSTEKGLIVPVVRDADQKTFAEIEKIILELAVKAREGTIGVEDLQGGTFTITNGGVFGSLLSTPILYPGQSGILGMHTIQKRPVAVNDQVVIRPMMYLALSYDHRLIDGREAVQFLVRVKECVENPERMLLNV